MLRSLRAAMSREQLYKLLFNWARLLRWLPLAGARCTLTIQLTTIKGGPGFASSHPAHHHWGWPWIGNFFSSFSYLPYFSSSSLAAPPAGIRSDSDPKVIILLLFLRQLLRWNGPKWSAPYKFKEGTWVSLARSPSTLPMVRSFLQALVPAKQGPWEREVRPAWKKCVCLQRRRFITSAVRWSCEHLAVWAAFVTCLCNHLLQRFSHIIRTCIHISDFLSWSHYINHSLWQTHDLASRLSIRLHRGARVHAIVFWRQFVTLTFSVSWPLLTRSVVLPQPRTRLLWPLTESST